MSSETPRPQDDSQATRPQIHVDDSGALAMYANFCRVTGTPEEVILDFALNADPRGVPAQPLQVKQRIIVNFYTAKRMLHALALTIQRHEAAFGPLETDVHKRADIARQAHEQRPRG